MYGMSNSQLLSTEDEIYANSWLLSNEDEICVK